MVRHQPKHYARDVLDVVVSLPAHALGVVTGTSNCKTSQPWNAPNGDSAITFAPFHPYTEALLSALKEGP